MAKRKNRDAEAPAKLGRKEFEAELYKLDVELCRLQDWTKQTGYRAVVIFEGRDAAGKGGVIKRITERVSPRVFRVVALPAPTEREKSQFYIQRYVAHLPAAGEITLFDRSWYNRAGVERVMGFCTEEQAQSFLRVVPGFERALTRSGIQVVKYFFDVSQDEQERRFRDRIEDPRKQWKLSPMDLESYRRWWEYSAAYKDMIDATDSEFAPWYKVPADDKRRARLNCIAHMLSLIPYESVAPPDHDLGKRRKPKGAPVEPQFSHVVPERF
ncbi:MAG TPA: polyphosphate kinase 2 [Geminicoccaceae bacterium]|nr:polyphosphate kinase 2 [Geminicoccaceae bacterium]